MKLTQLKTASEFADNLDEAKRALDLLTGTNLKILVISGVEEDQNSAVVFPDTKVLMQALSDGLKAEIAHLENELRLLGFEV